MTALRLPAPGDMVGRYRVLAELARGGMGVVLRGVDAELQRPVAIKVLAADAPDDETVARFKTEARATARLDHPNLVGVLDVGVDAGRPYLVMPLIEGESLSDRLHHGGPLDQAAALELGLALADGMAYAHARGVLHRDLKPQNVLVEAGGRVKVTDFGMARLLDPPVSGTTTLIRLTLDGQVLGTPAYMAPEQALGRVDEVDARSDVFGLGAVLYAAVTGEAPAKGITPAQVLRAAVSRDPEPLGARRPDLSPGFCAVVHRCLAKEPADRFPTADALLAALRALQAGPATPVAAEPAATGPTPQRPRSPLPIALGVAGVGLALAALIVLAPRPAAPGPSDGSPGPSDPGSSASSPGASSPAPSAAPVTPSQPASSPSPAASLRRAPPVIRARDWPLDAPALPAGAERWRWPQEEALDLYGGVAAGPYAVLRARGEPWRAVDVRGDAEQALTLPPGSEACFWDAARERLLVLAGEPAHLLAVDADEQVTDLGAWAPRAASGDPERIYLAGKRLVALDAAAPERVAWQVDDLGRLDHAPLPLDLDGDGLPERLLVVDCAGLAALFDPTDGARLAEWSLPGPVRDRPVLLSGSDDVLVACSDGSLVRLRVEARALEPVASLDLGSALTAAPAVARDRAGAPTQVGLATADLGLVVVTPALELLWATGPPAERGDLLAPRGDLVAVDLDRDGHAEWCSHWRNPRGKGGGGLWVFDDQGRPRATLAPGRALAVSAPGLVNLSGGRAMAYGPWTSLPAPRPVDFERAVRNALVGAWERVAADAPALGDAGRALLGLAAMAQQRPTSVSRREVVALVDWIERSRPTPILASQRLVQAVGGQRSPVAPPERPVGSVPWKKGPARGAWFYGRDKPPRVNGLRLTSRARRQRSNWLGPLQTFRAEFSLDAPAAVTLRLRHRAILAFDWGYAAIGIEVDDRVVVGEWAAPATGRLEERFELGRLDAGDHTLVLRVAEVSPTPYEVERLVLDLD